jgi:hypothetical protein
VAQVDAILEKKPEARVIAIRSPAPGDWPETLLVRNRPFRVHWCESSLAARQALLEAESPQGDGVILLTGLPEAELGVDVMSRLSGARVFQPDGWDMVRRAFQAKEVDSRLGRRGWMASILMETLPPEGYPPVAGGFLDLDSAWKQVLDGLLGLPEGRPDTLTLLRWSMTAEASSRFASLADDVKRKVSTRLAECAGPVGGFIMGCMDGGFGADALPLGLVCGVIFSPAGVGKVELAAAAGRLERYTGGIRVAAEDGRRWADAAAALVRLQPVQEARPFLERADSLLRELHLTSYAALSDILPAGFEGRMEVLADALQSLLAKTSAEHLAALEAAAESVFAHDLGRAPGGRAERVRMAQRLARWLATPYSPPKNFAEAVHGYSTQECFADWARLKLAGGDELAAVSTAYAALADRAQRRREEFSRAFALALKAWNMGGASDENCIPVERVLDAILAPLARKHPVLFLVVDGLSYPIFRELAEDLGRIGWIEMIASGVAAGRVAVAALPTVTEISRTSLLSGRLAGGAAGNEKSAFASHPGLFAGSNAAAKPLLFHKGELGDGLGLAQEVRDTVGNASRKVVGLVYNAVDDHLSGSNQLHHRWSLEDLRLMKPLLHEARLAGRVLVIASDHGHVMDEKTVQRGAGEGDRWRVPVGAQEDDEVLFEGGRVLAPGGAKRVVCAWSEHLRYGSKKNGYHGGVSPQEVLVPVAVFAPPRTPVEDWQPAPPPEPEWWEGTAFTRRPMAVPLPVKSRKPRAELTADLFQDQEPIQAIHWVDALLASPTYLQQRQLAARVAPQDEIMRRLLQALEDRGGKLGKSALAQKLGLPLIRVSGIVNAARRVLNVDQAPVLSLDESAGLIDLNRELLDVQFQLKNR